MPQIIKKIKYNLLLFVPQLSCFAGHPKEKEAFTSGSPVQRRGSLLYQGPADLLKFHGQRWAFQLDFNKN